MRWLPEPSPTAVRTRYGWSRRSWQGCLFQFPARQLTGRVLSAERIMAWQVRQALGDVLWRSEAGIPLPDHRSPGEWVDDIAARLSAFSITIR